MNASDHLRLQKLCSELPPESTIRSILEVALAHGLEHPLEDAVILEDDPDDESGGGGLED
ncbi:MAG: hypothetical protein AB1405_10415 [Bdellovibrionota bacterium]